MALRTNSYPGTCSQCSVAVGANEGFIYKDRVWKVVCRSAECGRRAGLDVDAPAPKRTVDAEGVIRMPKDYSALPTLRAIAKFDKTDVVWRCHTSTPELLARAIEGCKSLGLDGVELLEAKLASLTSDVEAVVEAANARAAASPAYDYQREGIAWLASRTNALLGDDMGLGKTIQVLIALPEDARCIVVAPKSLGVNWANEVRKWRADLTPVRATKWQDLRAPKAGEVMITHYECVRSLANAVKKGSKYTTGKQVGPKGTPAIALDATGCTLVSDESHRLKSSKAQLTKAFRALSKQADRVWLATGTPLLNRPPELWGVLQAADLGAEAFEGGWNTFMDVMGGYHGRFGIEWGTPDDTVGERLARVMLRRTKAEALPGLPGKVYSELVVNGLSKSLTKVLDEISVKHARLLDAGKLPPFEDIAECRKLIATARIAAAEEWVADREDAGEPVLVFSAHRAPVETIGAREGWAMVTGDTSAEQRAEIVDQFQAGELKGVALTIGAGREGLTLTAAATILFVDLDWTPALNAQAEDRVCRIGQRADRCMIVRMVSEHPVDQRITELLSAKTELVEKTVEAARHAEAASLSPLPEYTAPADETPSWVEETEDAWLKRIADMANAKSEADRERVRTESKRKAGDVVRRKGWTAPELTDAQVDAMARACAELAAVCDGAFTQDGMGFNKVDTAYGKWLGMVGLEDTDCQALAYGMLRKYRDQLGATWDEIYG